MISLLPALLARRRLVLAFWVLAAAAMVPGALRLKTNNSPEIFFLAGSPAVARYREFESLFGRDEGVRLVASGERLWSAEGLAWLATTEERIRALSGVATTTGLASRHRRSERTWPPAHPAAFRAAVTNDQLDRELGLVDPHGEVATILATLDALPPPAERALLAGLRALLAGAPPGLDVRLVGTPLLDEALNDSSREIEERYFPLLVLIAGVLLAATFRERAGVLVPLLFVGVCELLLLGPPGYLGVELNLILALLPPLLFVIALATAVHLLTRWRDFAAEGLSAPEATVATYRDKGRAILWTGISTGVGFASLASSPVAPIRELGVWAGVGIALLVLAAFTLYPCLLAGTMGQRASLPERRFELAMQRQGRLWSARSARFHRPIYAAYAAIALLAVFGLLRLRAESNALTYLAPEDPVRSGIETLERQRIGVSTVEVWFRLPPAEEGGQAAVEALDGVAELAGKLRHEPLVLGAVSAHDFVSEIATLSPPGRSPAELIGLAMQDPEARQALAAFFSAEEESLRLTLFVRTVGRIELAPLLNEIRAHSARLLPDAEMILTGQYLLLLETQDYLLTTLWSSLALTLPALTLAFFWLLRSWRRTLLALIPNVWPVAVILGGMGWLGLRLDIATVMVASILLGLVVDDTIHTLAHYRDLAPTLGGFEAVVSRVEKAAPAFLLTGLILMSGFGVCVLSRFEPTARFGALAVVAIAIALASDLLLVPALFGGERSSEEGTSPEILR